MNFQSPATPHAQHCRVGYFVSLSVQIMHIVMDIICSDKRGVGKMVSEPYGEGDLLSLMIACMRSFFSLPTLQRVESEALRGLRHISRRVPHR